MNQSSLDVKMHTVLCGIPYSNPQRGAISHPITRTNLMRYVQSTKNGMTEREAGELLDEVVPVAAGKRFIIRSGSGLAIEFLLTKMGKDWASNFISPKEDNIHLRRAIRSVLHP